jgi:hypothetical protein
LESARRALNLVFSEHDAASSQRSSGPHNQSTSKFRICPLVFWHAKVASEGLSSAAVWRADRGLEVVGEEMEKNGTDEDVVYYTYVRSQGLAV